MNIFNHSVTDKRQHVKVVLTLVSLFLLLSHSKPDPQGQTVCAFIAIGTQLFVILSHFFFHFILSYQSKSICVLAYYKLVTHPEIKQ